VKTECTPEPLRFHALQRREVSAEFDGGFISSDGGGLLLRETEARVQVLSRLAGCFHDYRDPDLIEHPVEALVKQRVYGVALGYEDLNDHDQLRHDPLLAVLCDKPDPTGQDRVRAQDKGKALAGKSTLNRLELTPKDATPKDRYKKIVANPAAMDKLLVDVFLEAHPKRPQWVTLDIDATDDRVHGDQEGKFFSAYYGDYCYLPLYIFCGHDLLCARLRTADQDAAAGTLDEVTRIVAQIRQRWPQVRVLVRGDSGFCREELMAWCEQNRVDYLLGLSKNSRLTAELKLERALARLIHDLKAMPARAFKDFRYRTRKSWSRERRVVGKAEHLDQGENPRFVVTSLHKRRYDAKTLYEQVYCERGNMENRIKEQQLDLFADRTSTHQLYSNQLRLYFSSFAYVLLQALRRLGLKGTEMAQAQAGTIRLKLLKLGARVTLSVRRVRIAFSENYPWRDLFRQVLQQLWAIPARE
jgi:hypothetical protein